MAETDIIQMARDAYYFASEVFECFNNAVKGILKVSFVDPENQDPSEDRSDDTDTNQSDSKVMLGDNASELGEKSNNSPTTAPKTDRNRTGNNKFQVQDSVVQSSTEPSKNDPIATTSSHSANKTNNPGESTAAQQITRETGAMATVSPSGNTSKRAKKKGGKKKGGKQRVTQNPQK